MRVPPLGRCASLIGCDTLFPEFGGATASTPRSTDGGACRRRQRRRCAWPASSASCRRARLPQLRARLAGLLAHHRRGDAPAGHDRRRRPLRRCRCRRSSTRPSSPPSIRRATSRRPSSRCASPTASPTTWRCRSPRRRRSSTIELQNGAPLDAQRGTLPRLGHRSHRRARRRRRSAASRPRSTTTPARTQLSAGTATHAHGAIALLQRSRRRRSRLRLTRRRAPRCGADSFTVPIRAGAAHRDDARPAAALTLSRSRARTASALTRVSASSSSGSESATMPPPTPRQSSPPRTTAVRIASASSRRARRPQPAERAAVGPAHRPLQLVDDLDRAQLGRAGDRSAGQASRAGSPRAAARAASCARTVDTR